MSEHLRFFDTNQAKPQLVIRDVPTLAAAVIDLAAALDAVVAQLELLPPDSTGGGDGTPAQS